MDPHWDDMRVFLSVAREESLSGAGKRLKMDPATVGRRIARFEAVMETTLFAKSPQGYTLTGAGERLLRHGEDVELAMRAGVEALSGSEDTLSGQIRIGAPDGCAYYVLSPICSPISQANPDLDIQIVALPRVVNLNRREADMAITVSPPTAGQYHVEKITDYKLFMAGSRHYLDRNPPIETIQDLKHHRMIGYIPDMIYDAELDYLRDLGLERVALASNSVPLQVKMVEQGDGLSVTHAFAMPHHRVLRKVLADEVSFTRSFYLVRHKSDIRSDRMNRLADAIMTGVRDKVAELEEHV